MFQDIEHCLFEKEIYGENYQNMNENKGGGKNYYEFSAHTFWISYLSTVNVCMKGI